jgi:hypothetical protein
MAIIIPGSGNAMCWTDIEANTNASGDAVCRFLAIAWTNPCALTAPLWRLTGTFGDGLIDEDGNVCSGSTGFYFRLYPGVLYINHRVWYDNGGWSSSFVVNCWQAGDCNVGDTEWIGAKVITHANDIPYSGGTGVVGTNYTAAGDGGLPSLDCSQNPTTKVATFTIYDDDSISVTSP